MRNTNVDRSGALQARTSKPSEAGLLPEARDKREKGQRGHHSRTLVKDAERSQTFSWDDAENRL